MMNRELVLSDVIVAMRATGWVEGRSVDVSTWAGTLIDEGFKPFNRALEIAKEFDGLHLKPIRSTGSSDDRGDVEFSLASVTGTIDRTYYAEFKEFVKEVTFPLGMVYGTFFLHVGESGRFYFEGDGRIVLLSESLESFLNLMILGVGRAQTLVDNRRSKTS